MKILLSFLLAFFLLAAANQEVFAQNKKLTIILLRHAEKDLSDAENPDPVLSPEGEARARRLVQTIRKYKPDAIYTSNYKRTRSTVTPLAEKIRYPYKLQMQIYDHRKLDDFAARLLASNKRRIVVVGHNTTTPALANLLTKQNKYKALDESEYDKIWIIEIKKGKAKDKITVY
ncbi:MAG: phosphoglycerate mutase [Acidobacteria bacterium]|jgi:2,3-bisphosphoglycerate-dependent phosphoglycerate mutase|nr:phosphoglycerate mutase [Acidobacteriota bacterium]